MKRPIYQIDIHNRNAAIVVTVARAPKGKDRTIYGRIRQYRRASSASLGRCIRAMQALTAGGGR
jgi:hypothetical protein